MRILITGGGTGGHLYPALAVAHCFQETVTSEILFVGTKNGLEARVVPENGYSFRSVWIGGLHRGRIIKNLLFPLKMAVSFIQAFILLIQFKPDVVFGFGGYVSWPVLRAAILLKRRTVLHEQNQFPGLVTRVLAQGADQVFLSFEGSREFLNTGNKHGR